MKQIIVDTLGADNGSLSIINGTLRALKEIPDISVVFVGVKKEIEDAVKTSGVDPERISIIHTEEFVPDDAAPTCVFRGSDNTSMVMALKELKENNNIIGMLSTGNTGALLVGTIFRLGLVPGLRTPVLSTMIPCKKEGMLCLVDCGANTDCTPEDLKRFAIMGNIFSQLHENIESPKVALMSVGKTPHKGNTLVKEAYPLIESLPINFIGNIEGNDLVNSEADVIVTDGFTGNVLLKNTESAGLAAISIVESTVSDESLRKEITDKLYRMFAFNDRGGAVFLGTQKTVVKMHGCANEDTAYACVNLLFDLENKDFASKVADAIKSI